MNVIKFGCGLAFMGAALTGCSPGRRLTESIYRSDSLLRINESSSATFIDTQRLLHTDRIEKITVTLGPDRDTVRFEREVTVEKISDSAHHSENRAYQQSQEVSLNKGSTVATVEKADRSNWFDRFRIKAFNWLFTGLATGIIFKLLIKKFL